MGLLKHVLLPAFGLMHATYAAASKDLTSWSKLCGVGMPPPESKDGDDVATKHMVSVIRGFNLTMAFLCAWGVVHERAHFRGQVILAEAVLFGYVTFNAIRMNVVNYTWPLLSTIVAGAGYYINSKEPGIFTKDHSS